MYRQRKLAHDADKVLCRPAKFPNVTSITLFFPASQGADTTRIYYVGFLGQWSEVSRHPPSHIRPDVLITCVLLVAQI